MELTLKQLVRTAVATGAQGDINASTYTTAVFLTASGSGAQSITGGSGSDTLVGGAGAEVITSGDGNDTMTGGAAADTFTFNNTKAGTYTITDYGVGADIVSASGVNATINATLATVAGVTLGNTNIDADTTLNVTITDDVATTNAVSFAAGTNSGKLVVDASANNNGIKITGTGGTDTITAGSGGDEITGGAGVDSIVLGAGADTVVATLIATADKVTGFTAGASGDKLSLDVSAINTALSDKDLVDSDANTDISADDTVVLSAAISSSGAIATGKNVLLLGGTTAAANEAILDGSTVNVAVTEGDAFVVAFIDANSDLNVGVAVLDDTSSAKTLESTAISVTQTFAGTYTLAGLDASNFAFV